MFCAIVKFGLQPGMVSWSSTIWNRTGTCKFINNIDPLMTLCVQQSAFELFSRETYPSLILPTPVQKYIKKSFTGKKPFFCFFAFVDRLDPYNSHRLFCLLQGRRQESPDGVFLFPSPSLNFPSLSLHCPFSSPSFEK